ncbi:hypothetical protein EVA_14580 [gut metagenome]|uniref:Uncharacterized protein n=1 Tax=gut metagenome TaxID=749906 RepID=J9FQT5_9ZZZZ
MVLNPAWFSNCWIWMTTRCDSPSLFHFNSIGIKR